MPRTYGLADLVQLPRLDAAGALTLLTSLLRAARKEPSLPGGIPDALKPLEQARKALKKALGPKSKPKPPDARKADVNEDNAWGALFGWLGGFARLPPGVPEGDQARELLAVLFGDEGLAFTQLKYKLEWAEAEARIDRIHERKLEPAILGLGGKAILTNLRAAHQVYGAALGVTEALPVTSDPAAPQLKAELDEARASLRRYVVKVTAVEDEDLSARLLESLLSWDVSQTLPDTDDDMDGDEDDSPPAPPPDGKAPDPTPGK